MNRERPPFPPSPEGFRWVEKGGVCFLQSVLLADHPWLDHAFCTRWRGASEGAFAGLNFSVREGDGEDAVRRNWGRLSEAFGIPADRFVTLRQVHGTRLVSLEDRTEAVPEGDGLVAARRGFAVGIKTADCVPILIADPVAGAVCAVHAGWRGTAMGIAEKAVEAMRRHFASEPSRLIAAIGPAIGPCCYEVDEPVFRSMEGRREKGAVFEPLPGRDRWRLDLAKANEIQLAGSGLGDGRIHAANLCTSCNRGLFFSHRGEGGMTGRQLNFIVIRSRREETGE
jgi:YfiH family protein